MGRFIIIVLDGFGIGEMKDTKEVRVKDVGSNTFKHIIGYRTVNLPTLEKLGICNSANIEFGNMKFSKTAKFGKANLMHFGADTFYGHQEIMGSKPKKPLEEAFSFVKEKVKTELKKHGYSVREYGKGVKILVVNECVTIGDNLETDFGQVYNVTSALDLISFEEVKKIGKIVRDNVYTSRVITFGGEGITLQNILDAYVEKNKIYAGIDAPKSGVYNKGYSVIHLGYGVNSSTQVPTILGKNNIGVYLFGKVADIVQNDYGVNLPGVDTEQVFRKLIEKLKSNIDGFFCLNVQETDLAGHQQDVDKYIDVLKISDKNINKVIELMNTEDILIVMADHGNDPLIGHSQHTREQVPILIYKNNMVPGYIGELSTLSDVGATALDYFGFSGSDNGQAFSI
ncbi:TPA: phosphopentomutase [Clostridioides difficile]|nr:phosphopentomutase [Clostridioides difficile]